MGGASRFGSRFIGNAPPTDKTDGGYNSPTSVELVATRTCSSSN